MKKDVDVLEAIIELVEKVVKGEEILQKVITVPRAPPPFLQRLVKKIEDGTNPCFITMKK